jgi:hypothetical protein
MADVIANVTPVGTGARKNKFSLWTMHVTICIFVLEDFATSYLW